MLRIVDTAGGRLLGKLRLTDQTARALLVLPGDRLLLVGESATPTADRAYSWGGFLDRPGPA